MQHVKLPLMNKEFFLRHVNNEPALTEDFECTKLLLETCTYHIGFHESVIPSQRTISRKQMPGQQTYSYIFAIGGRDGMYRRINLMQLVFYVFSLPFDISDSQIYYCAIITL